MSVRVLQGDCRLKLANLEAGSAHCVVTSPPYFGLRDYGTATWVGGDAACDHYPPSRPGVTGQRATRTFSAITPYGDVCGKCGAERRDQQIGIEQTPAAYVAAIVDVFRQLWRVLRDDGTAWLNLGDSYAGSWGNYAPNGIKGTQRPRTEDGQRWGRKAYADTAFKPATADGTGLRPKNLIGIPWRVALALQDDGWILRSDIIWAKQNCMPESVTDRPTRSHEYLFLLSKSERYYYDAQAIAEPSAGDWTKKGTAFLSRTGGATAAGRNDDTRREGTEADGAQRNKRTVWQVATTPHPFAHFAVMPQALIEPCILAGTSAKGCCPACGAGWKRVLETPQYPRELRAQPGQDGVKVGYGHAFISTTGSGQKMQDWRAANPATTTGWEPGCRCDAGEPIPSVVLDPFAGSGTTLRVATKHGRDAIGIELNPAYIDIVDDRTTGVQMSLESVVS